MILMYPTRISTYLSSMIDNKNVAPMGLSFNLTSWNYQNFSPTGFFKKKHHSTEPLRGGISYCIMEFSNISALRAFYKKIILFIKISSGLYFAN